MHCEWSRVVLCNDWFAVAAAAATADHEEDDGGDHDHDDIIIMCTFGNCNILCTS